MPIDALSVLCAQLTRDLLAIANFLLDHTCEIVNVHRLSPEIYTKTHVSKYVK